MKKEIQKIWLRNNRTGILFEIPKSHESMYNAAYFELASKEQVNSYKEGTYWDKEATASKKQNDLNNDGVIDGQDASIAGKALKETTQTEVPKMYTGLSKKNKDELLAIIDELDPQHTFDADSVKADIIAAIELIQEL